MAIKSPGSEAYSKLYAQDYYLWLEKTAQLLRDGKLADLDISNLIEEIESMGRSEKRAVYSNLKVLLIHLLKYRYQPDKRSNSWRATIREHRQRLLRSFQESPSLKPYFEEVIAGCYQDAKELAADETGLSREAFPKSCPFTAEEILNSDYLL